ncbi:hypothetical protein [Litorilituus lipolyticus]|uniref:RcsF protein n=1 Tax=Litorilituus lipolyticus TaxID=2491017 RepID=A0A502KMY3_9GAMM|nr:hypothetical protein [Litorilituus lipolyticus]TPH12796.1 hypothetical protein EPA86_15330 [Litorilituus lipolyticus]
MKKILVTLSILSLYGCSTLSVDTNLGRHVDRAIRASVVEEFSHSEIFSMNARALGPVETDYCQLNISEPMPSKKSLHKTLKAETQFLGGNAIVYDECKTSTGYFDCKKYVRCRAIAYLVSYP